MMTKTRSASWTLVKVMIAFPAFFAILFLFTAGSANDLSAQNNQQQVKPAEEPKAITQEKLKTEEPVFKVVETMPSFPGGLDAMIKYLVDNIKYPEEAKKSGLQGTVYITFVTETDGTVSNVKVLRGIGGGCDEEGVRVVSSMPRWNPGKEKGKPVRVQYNLPIKFALK